jgi:hypothetical protein
LEKINIFLFLFYGLQDFPALVAKLFIMFRNYLEIAKKKISVEARKELYIAELKIFEVTKKKRFSYDSEIFFFSIF